MWRRVALASLLASTAYAFAPAPIVWRGPTATRFVLAPESEVTSDMAASWSPKLTIVDTLGITSTRIPGFTAKPDDTIAWDAMDWCIEASGIESGDSIRASHCTGEPNQRWNWLPLEGVRDNQIQLKGTDQCLDVIVAKRGDLNGAPIELRECGSKVTAVWRFERSLPLPALVASQQPLHHVISPMSLAMLGMLSLGAWWWRSRGKPDSSVAIQDRGGVALTLPFASHHGSEGIGLRLHPAMMALSPIAVQDEDSRGEEENMKRKDNFLINTEAALHRVDPIIASFTDHRGELRMKTAEQILENQPTNVSDVELESTLETETRKAHVADVWARADLEDRQTIVEQQEDSSEQRPGLRADLERLQSLPWKIIDFIEESKALPFPVVVMVLSPEFASDDEDTSEIKQASGGAVNTPLGELANDLPESVAEEFARREREEREAGRFPLDTIAEALERREAEKDRGRINYAPKRMQKDGSLLDPGAGGVPLINSTDFAIIITALATAASAPWLFERQTCEVLVPCAGALVAAMSFNAEYNGKVAIARGHEIAAQTQQAAAESDLYVARAERAKAVIPLCVGTSAVAAALSVAAPAIVAEFTKMGLAALTTEIFLICPLVAGGAAGLATLAATESAGLASVAISVGDRRFAARDNVSRTWLSATEQIKLAGVRVNTKWLNLAIGMMPAPVLAGLFPGSLGLKAIVASGVAAAQATYAASKADFMMSKAVEAVALKTRYAALTDTFASQGGRSTSIFPFTSALSGLCAGLTVTAVEFLPKVASLAGQSLLCVALPSLAAVFASAAMVSKECALVDTESAAVAATSIAENAYKNSDVWRQQAPISLAGTVIGYAIDSTREQWKQMTDTGNGNRVQKTKLKIKKKLAKLTQWELIKRLARRLKKTNGLILAAVTRRRPVSLSDISDTQEEIQKRGLATTS